MNHETLVGLRIRFSFHLFLHASDQKYMTSKLRPYGFRTVCATLFLCALPHPHGHTLRGSSSACSDSCAATASIVARDAGSPNRFFGQGCCSNRRSSIARCMNPRAENGSRLRMPWARRRCLKYSASCVDMVPSCKANAVGTFHSNIILFVDSRTKGN